MKNHLFAKSIVLIGNFFILTFFLFFLRMVTAVRLRHVIFVGLLATFIISLFSSILCSASSEMQDAIERKRSKPLILLKLFAGIYAVLFLIIGIFLSIRIKDFGLPPLLFSSTVQAFEKLSAHATEPIKRPISNERLLWENTLLTFKQLLTSSDYQLRTTKLLRYSISFFNYKTLRFLFQEIFLQNIYHFTTDAEKPVIIDCGSNMGMSILFFKTLYPNARIIGFEPDPKAFQVLKLNIEQNNLTEVQVINKAVAEKDGLIPFYYANNSPGHLCNSTTFERSMGTNPQQLVPATILSRFINQQIDFLKMDIEGAETSVIQELAQQNKLGLVKQMIIEFHHHLSSTAQDKMATLLKTLQDAGFTYQINANSIFPFCANQRQDILIFAYQK